MNITRIACCKDVHYVQASIMLKQKHLNKFEDLNEEISYKQWVSVDRTELISQSLSISDYINLTITKLESLVHHHYIAHSQSSYLKLRKETMEENSALILMDFAENYV